MLILLCAYTNGNSVSRANNMHLIELERQHLGSLKEHIGISCSSAFSILIKNHYSSLGCLLGAFSNAFTWDTYMIYDEPSCRFSCAHLAWYPG